MPNVLAVDDIFTMHTQFNASDGFYCAPDGTFDTSISRYIEPY